MGELPTGTVTFLFTDIEGSTRLLREHGERYAGLLSEHRRVLRDTFASHRGVEVDTQGDAFFVAFSRASDALAAAGEAQDALEAMPVRVRIGLHTGEPTVTDEGYVGLDVHKAARLMSAGHGGQVLVSEQTARLARPSDNLLLVDLGLHRLKDLSEPQRIYQLGDREFPRLRTLFQTNLPVPANPLVGRKMELADVRRLLADDGSRVVTLTGPGGIGKTRFALAAAGEAGDAFPDGVWFVDLTPLRDPALVLPTIARTIGAEGDPAAFLGDGRALLVLDNFEQVVDAAGDVAALVAACPRAQLLVTSREPLRIAPEREYPLRPLPESPAVELFRQRTVPDVEVDYAVAAEICRRLDGLPLAIELAAARVKVFDPETLLARLEQRLPLLVSRARDVPERQRTLHSTIQWSYELLTGEEQQLFRRLAVFAGGATLEAIEAVAEGDAELVESLVDKSLLRRRGERFVMLETILEFAWLRLDESGNADALRRRHAEFFLRVAEDANLSTGTLDLRKPMRRDVAFAEGDNIRAALAWAVASGNAALGLALAQAVEWFWVLTDPREGMRWFEALFERAERDTVRPEVRAHALRAYAAAADIAGFDEQAAALYERSLIEFTRLGDDDGRAKLLHRVGIQAMRRGDLERARALVEESHELHLRNEDPLARDWGLTQTTGTLGAIARDAGDRELAHELATRATELARGVGNEWWTGGMLAELAALELAGGSVDDADAHARASLRIAAEQRDHASRVFGVGLRAGVSALRGDAVTAGRLWGAVEGEQTVAPLGGWRRHRDAVAELVGRLAGPELERAVAAGRELSLDEAVEEALAES